MLNIKSRIMTNEKMLREDKKTLLRNSIIPFSQSPHQPKSKKPSNAAIRIAIPPSAEPARSGGLNVMCEDIVNAKYNHMYDCHLPQKFVEKKFPTTEPTELCACIHSGNNSNEINHNTVIPNQIGPVPIKKLPHL
jgi:hypothetical protein